MPLLRDIQEFIRRAMERAASGSVPPAEGSTADSELQNEVISKFSVDNSYQVIKFEKYTTSDVSPFKLIVSNSSEDFGIKFFHTASENTRIIITSGSTVITKENPVILYPKSGSFVSSVELLADINTNGLNSQPDEDLLDGNQLVEDIYFNLVKYQPYTNVTSALPGIPLSNDVYKVDTLAPSWRETTTRGPDGLGVGALDAPETLKLPNTTVLFSRTKLTQKKDKLQQFKSFLQRGFGFTLASSSGASARSRKLRGYKIIVYGILFDRYPRLNFADFNSVNPRDIWESFDKHTNWNLPDSDPTAESLFTWPTATLDVFEGDLRTGPSVDIITAYIDLIDDILAQTTGLSEKVAPITTAGFSVNEESRVDTKIGSFDIDLSTSRYSIFNALLSASKALVNLKTLQFFDEDREYKTILNLGLDQQYLVESWRTVPSDSASIQLKLLEPLDTSITLYQSASIVRDFAKTVIDTINFELVPEEDTTPFLRPRNLDVGRFKVDSQTIKNVTLTSLGLQTGSVGAISASVISYEDRTFNRWYTADFNSSELNIDFSNYNNFVFFGSAEARLNAFANKLRQIANYSTTISTAASTLGERKNALEIESIKRNFDPYEQFLYYASESIAYSASAYYTDNSIEYNATGSWPKMNGVPLPYSSVQSWYATQSAIARRYDEFNTNQLVKHLPYHIQEDENSVDFISFINMFGHIMDNIKVYIDQFPNIYSTSPNPFDELSMDQVYEVAKSFGLELPNAYSLEALQTFISSLYDGNGARAFIAETWKRFIHSSVYIQKLKGTRTGADAIISTYGLNSPLVQIKESAYAVEGNYIKSDESVYGLHMTASVSSSISIPFVSSSYSASNIQIRFLPELRQKSSLLTTNGTWGIDVVPYASSSTNIQFNAQSSRGLTSYFTITPQTINYGRIEIISGSSRSIIASSSYFPIFSDLYTHIMLRSQSQDITIIQTDGDQILHEESASINLGNLWNTEFVYIGGTGSLRFNNFDGIIDDVRVWGENTTKDNFIKQAYDPGSYYGTNYSSSYSSLYVDLSFSQKYLSITQSLTNESPFYAVTNLNNIQTTGFNTSSYVRILRTIKQFTPIVGSSIFSNKKVTVAPPPVFPETTLDEDGVKTLQINGSIKSIEDKKYVGGQDYVQFAISPTDFINQTIIRSMGDVDTNYLIGSPRKYSNGRYTELDNVFSFFIKNYNERIDANRYIRFFKNVLKAPSEYMESYVPARSKLVNGIVIESPMLDRSKTYIQRSIKVDGSNTRKFESFVSGSGSVDVGAYDFLAYYPSSEQTNTTLLTNPTNIIQQIGNKLVTSSILSRNGGIGFIDASINNTESVGLVSSTVPSQLPRFRQLLQSVGTFVNGQTRYASSSIMDNNSSIGMLESVVDAEPRSYISQSGYPRNPYLGLRTIQNEQLFRVQSELNTFKPIYAIPPVSDFLDVGTTTYFHLNSGLYWLPSRLVDTKELMFRKEYYRTKLNLPIGEIESELTKELSNITLLDQNQRTDDPGRFSIKIPKRTYGSTPYRGVLNIANIISLYRVQGPVGLRVRLYSSLKDQENDLNRSFTTVPTTSAGVLFDGLLDGQGDVFPYVLIQTNNSILYFTVDNITTNQITSDIILTYFEYEPANLVPYGYLPRHYRFTRTNNIAQRRKSYLGCKLIYCPEGCPPDLTDSFNKVGRVAPRRLENGTISMPELAIEAVSPVQVFSSPSTTPVVNNPEVPGGGEPPFPPPPPRFDGGVFPSGDDNRLS